ncbi:MAG: hypothetical protein AB1452_06150 [Pseudomonadota bacterium]
MRNVTMEAIRTHPELLAALEARARRARAEAVHGAFARLVRKLTPRLDLRSLSLHWG